MATAKERDAAFERDVRGYTKVLPSLLKRHVGKWALVGNGEFYDVFSTEEEAILKGKAKYGQALFMVRQVAEGDIEAAREWLAACHT